MNLKKEEETSCMNISNDGNISSDPIIKVEDAFYTAQKKYKDKNIKLCPLAKQGKVLWGVICDSKHWT